MSILVLNAGSSTLKFSAFDAQARTELVSGLVDWGGGAGPAKLTWHDPDGAHARSEAGLTDHGAATTRVIALLQATGSITVVGHRVVHGGVRFRASTLVDDAARTAIRELSELAPLHNPPALASIGAAQAALPGVPHVAVFDTAFFANLPRSASVYPLPYEWHRDWGVRRFGFHGISHAYCAGRVAEMLGDRAGPLHLVTCHLGNGCSATACRDGVAVATTMGFTPLDGLMMGTRSGSVDPGILTYVLRARGLSADALDDALNHHSGLLGVSGVSSDYRQVEIAADAGNERAQLALDLFAARVRSTIGSLAVTLGQLDALVFTAGIGTNSARLRASVCAGLGCLGVRLDDDRNRCCEPDADVAADQSSARILVLHTREELMIAREARRVAAG